MVTCIYENVVYSTDYRTLGRLRVRNGTGQDRGPRLQACGRCEDCHDGGGGQGAGVDRGRGRGAAGRRGRTVRAHAGRAAEAGGHEGLPVR